MALTALFFWWSIHLGFGDTVGILSRLVSYRQECRLPTAKCHQHIYTGSTTLAPTLEPEQREGHASLRLDSPADSANEAAKLLDVARLFCRTNTVPLFCGNPSRSSHEWDFSFHNAQRKSARYCKGFIAVQLTRHRLAALDISTLVVTPDSGVCAGCGMWIRDYASL